MSATLSQPNSDGSAPDICAVDLTLLKSNDRGNENNIVTADTVSPKGMTLPSLWWTSEQFPAKLIINWIANRREQKIYLLVNNQYWNGLDYLDRYRTIDKFGRVAQGYGYNLQICNSQKIVLARYACKDEDLAPTTLGVSTSAPVAKNRSTCQIWLHTSGQNGLGVKTN